MVRKIHILRNYSILALAASALLVVVAVAIISPEARATEASEGMSLTANVHEVLHVQITRPTSWASGNTGDFLSNKITVGVVTNNPNGFVASMTTDDATTVLTNTATGSTSTIPTLASAATAGASFPANYWGYSKDGNTYAAMVAKGASQPIELAKYTEGAYNGSQDVYFGAKINADTQSGTYSQGVIISVVSGAINTDTNPTIPTNPTDGENTPPVNPNPDSGNNYVADNNTSDNQATWVASNTSSTPRYYPGNSRTGVTIRTTESTNTQEDTESTTTEIAAGDVTSSFSNPLGVNKRVETNTSGEESSPLAAILVGIAGVTAAGGAAALILAKKQQ